MSKEYEDEQENEEEQSTKALIPAVQETIIFNDKPIVVVQLPDGQPGVVLRWICASLRKTIE